MVLLDPDTDAVVIRVVYDGPPEAGKTTSLRALAASLGQPAYTPEEVEGRTVFFDWLDYTGGLFEGHPIRCQVITVPGQATLAPRRRSLLATADVVVFVADTRREHLPALPAYLQGLASAVNEVPGPPVGVVFQANKRDHPESVPLGQVREILEALDLQFGMVESNAVDGSGIREAFVFAVRLALDRAREQLRAGQLPRVRPAVGNPHELLAQIRSLEKGALDLLPGTRLTHIRLHDITSVSDAPARPVASAGTEDGRVPRPPDSSVPGGLIWPAIKGRLLLHGLGPVEWRPRASGDGAWEGRIASLWRVQSPPGSIFPDLDCGRAALVDWARIHSASAGAISSDRCIVLASDHHDTWRLWQVVRLEETLADRLEEWLRGAAADDAQDATMALLYAVQRLREAAEVYAQASCRLPPVLASLRAARSDAPYVGFMPPPRDTSPPEPLSPSNLDDMVHRELEPYLRRWVGSPLEMRRILAALPPEGAAVGTDHLRRLLDRQAS